MIAFGAYYAFDGGVDFSRIDVGTFTEGVSDTDSLAMITLAFASFIGLEVTANYIESVHAAKQTYRKALLIAGACAVVVMIGTPLAVALTLPGRNIDLMTGVMRAFEVYATKYGVPWLVLPMGLIIGIATITQATAYMLAPAMGLQEVAYELRLAKPLHGLNDQGIPAQLLVIQGIIITVVSTVFAFAPNASVAFAIILNLVVMLYMGAYGLMYCAALRLRYTCPDLARPKPVPGGKIGLWLTCLTGLGSSIFLFVVGFAPPPPAMGLSATASLVTMLVGLAAATGAPFLLRGVRHPQPRGGLRVDP